MSLETLYEIRNVRQVKGDPARRWFYSRYIDLTVWNGSDGKLVGFQLTHRFPGEGEHALTWLEGRGFNHSRVDTGNGDTAYGRATPLLVPDGVFDKDLLRTRFEEASLDLPEEVVGYVEKALAAYPEPPTRTKRAKRGRKPTVRRRKR